MAVFKLLGTLVKVMENGKEKTVETKTYVRADSDNEARVKATEMGFVTVVVSYFCRNFENPLGEERHYAADNNRGVMTGF